MAEASGTPKDIKTTVGGKTVDRRVLQALKRIEVEGLSARLSLAKLARELNISNSRLRHLFKRDVGMSPTCYVRDMRLQKARELLLTTFLAVKEVMSAVGFADVSHFVRNYKRAFGETPKGTRTRIGQTRQSE